MGQEELPQVPWAKLEGKRCFSRSEAYVSGNMHPGVFYLFNERISGVAKLIWKWNWEADTHKWNQSIRFHSWAWGCLSVISAPRKQGDREFMGEVERGEYILSLYWNWAVSPRAAKLLFELCLFYLTKIICNIPDTHNSTTNYTELNLKIKINNKPKEVI